ncbi:MAG: MFS transporter [Rhodobacteraceae bacterium]|jgi:GPH family glycoside/pentoside/hexuronide:cation symporter|nr:MFS transporter [Paracoccaceae bacterium]MBL4558625.1 MFS transporter [Paracoccaceae bacterium]HBG97515.1 sugar:cation symporter [Paracoccaceae bacterium]
MTVAVLRRSAGLPGFAVFAAMLGAAGLPIYIHAPKVYVDEYGVSLAALGAVLFALRLIDVVQDPLLGWLADRLGARRGTAAGIGAALLGAAMLGLFAIAPPIAPLLWFALTLTLLFSAFSFLSIAFYAEGVHKAETLGPDGHVRVAAWRETGTLLGISTAAMFPTVALALGAPPYASFAAGFAILALTAILGMRGEWAGAAATAGMSGFRAVLRDRFARRLLIIALVNAAPLAVTSNLFLFFVESRLDAPGWEGPLLLLFFIAAAASAGLWARAAEARGIRPVLAGAMVLSILSFGWAATLGAGDIAAFAVICAASGAALGADMTLLPALFARRLAKIAPGGGQAFGLWAFVSKFTLAVAAGILLPTLAASGFQSGTDNPDQALWMLTVLYALVPCGLKLIAIALLVTLKMEEG